MKKLIKQTIILIIMLIIMSSNIYAAGLGAYKDAKGKVSTTVENFFKQIRNMETSTGTLGVSSTIDVTNGTYEDSSGNGIDCHMAKNTEWGTAALLAASIYGKAPSGTKSWKVGSTTQNEWGIYQMSDGTYEYVAGVYNKGNNQTSAKFFSSVDERYYNNYDKLTKYSITGDGIIETDGWKSANVSNFVEAGTPVFRRSVNALFGYYRYDGMAGSDYSSRAVVVCGAGL